MEKKVVEKKEFYYAMHSTFLAFFFSHFRPSHTTHHGQRRRYRATQGGISLHGSCQRILVHPGFL
jgi:hypothetical protein